MKEEEQEKDKQKLLKTLKHNAIASEGDCVWKALADGQGPPQCPGEKWATIKAHTIAHMKKYAEKCEKQWDQKEPSKEQKACSSFSDYILKLAAAQAWGGDLEIAAAAAKYDVPVLVHEELTGQVKCYKSIGKKKAFVLCFAKGHYDSLQGPVPADILQEFRERT